MMGLLQRYAMRIDVPSPLVGVGNTAGRPNLAWVRGSLPTPPMPREPLTRLRFAIADAKHRRSSQARRPKAAYAPSPTRGEGGICVLGQIA
jgi:hypothetical protein